jgi:hypothetical protein
MVHVVHKGPLTTEEKAMIEAAMINIEPDLTFDEERDHLPVVEVPLGFAIALEPLAWLVITFVGAGVGLLVSSFLKSIGTEAGKKLLDHFFGKARKGTGNTPPYDGTGLYPMAVVYEVKRDVVINHAALKRGFIPLPGVRWCSC